MGLRRRTESRRVQEDLLARVINAASIALEHRSEVDISGELPGGGRVRTSISMADVVGCIGMKGHALGIRHVEKDAYDIYAVLDNYGGGPEEVARATRPFGEEPLIRESLTYIEELFSTPNDAGPRWVADFYATELGEARERRRQRAYQVVQAFLGRLE